MVADPAVGAEQEHVEAVVVRPYGELIAANTPLDLHIGESLRSEAAHSPDRRLDDLIAELESYVPPAPPGPDHFGFAVPLRLRTGAGELRLPTTLTSFATAVDVTLAELRLEAFLPADHATAELLRRRADDGLIATDGRVDILGLC